MLGKRQVVIEFDACLFVMFSVGYLLFHFCVCEACGCCAFCKVGLKAIK